MHVAISIATNTEKDFILRFWGPHCCEMGALSQKQCSVEPV